MTLFIHADKDNIEKLAFDTRQYNHILWDIPQKTFAGSASRTALRRGLGEGQLNPMTATSPTTLLSRAAVSAEPLAPWCGIAASVTLAVVDLLLAVITPEYDAISETISEMHSVDMAYSTIARHQPAGLLRAGRPLHYAGLADAGA